MYEVNTNDILNYHVNANQTLADQKAQGRRPRFSIYSELIGKGNYISKKTFEITYEEIRVVK